MKPLGCIVIIAALASALCGCRRGDDNTLPEGAVAVIGSDVLTRDDIRRKLPAGVTPDDSISLARSFIRRWIDQRLVENVAAAEVDMDEVERLTKEYRSELIMSQYRRAMAAQTDSRFSEDSISAYYQAHSSDFILERPLIKGVYLKVPADAPNLATIRRLYRSERPVDIDKLEKAALGSATHYDYFRDSWVDWEQIETRIPLDFTSENLAKVSKGQPIDFTWQGYVYLLSVSDFLPAGSEMPLEAARPLVRERLLARMRRAYDKYLINELYDRSLTDGTIIFPSGNPLQ